MSVAWYAKRLASMSFPEVVHRVGEQAKRTASRHRSYGWEAFDRQGSLRPIPGLQATFYSGVTPALGTTIRESADAHIEGCFSAHGVSWPQRSSSDPFPREVWCFDPITQRLWPGNDRYCYDLKYRHRRDLGDIKFVWDFNRLQFMQPLAAAVALWDDRRALSTLETAISSWMQHNRPFCGLAWNSGIELSLRAVSLVLVASLCGDKLSPAVNSKLVTVLRAHLFWLGRFPSRFSSANNHLVAEALGEFLIASVLSDAGTEEIADKARNTLEREAKLQIHADGTAAEQSPNYGAFTAEMLLLASMVARAFGRPFDPSVDARLLAFSDFVGWLCDEQGRVPNIGDDDEGRVLTLCGHHEHAYPASVARAICSQFGAPAAAPASQDKPELRDAFFTPTQGPAPAPEGCRTFEVGGYSVVRERRAGRWTRLVFDHGPLGYLAIAAHGHADANAFTLALDGEDVLVDPGTYLYHSGGDWRNWFRGTPAHNTLTVEGADQSIIAGPFNWSHKAIGSMDAFEGGDLWRIAASHDGYVKRFGVRHRRVLQATGAGLDVLDTLPEATRSLQVEASWQFAPGLHVRRSGDVFAVHRGDKPLLRMAFSAPGEISTTCGGDEVHGGWVSQSFGHKAEATRLVWRGPLPREGLRTELNWLV